MIYYLQHILSAGCYTSLRCTVLHVSVIFTEKFSRIILLQLIKRILQKVGDQGPTQSLCANPAYSFFLMKWNYWLPLKQYSNISRFYKLIWYEYANLNHFFFFFSDVKSFKNPKMWSALSVVWGQIWLIVLSVGEYRILQLQLYTSFVKLNSFQGLLSVARWAGEVIIIS